MNPLSFQDGRVPVRVLSSHQSIGSSRRAHRPTSTVTPPPILRHASVPGIFLKPAPYVSQVFTWPVGRDFVAAAGGGVLVCGLGCVSVCAAPGKTAIASAAAVARTICGFIGLDSLAGRAGPFARSPPGNLILAPPPTSVRFLTRQVFLTRPGDCDIQGAA